MGCCRVDEPRCAKDVKIETPLKLCQVREAKDKESLDQ